MTYVMRVLLFVVALLILSPVRGWLRSMGHKYRCPVLYTGMLFPSLYVRYNVLNYELRNESKQCRAHTPAWQVVAGYVFIMLGGVLAGLLLWYGAWAVVDVPFTVAVTRLLLTLASANLVGTLYRPLCFPGNQESPHNLIELLGDNIVAISMGLILPLYAAVALPLGFIRALKAISVDDWYNLWSE